MKSSISIEVELGALSLGAATSKLQFDVLFSAKIASSYAAWQQIPIVSSSSFA